MSLLTALHASALVLPSSRVLVALSGGPDSCVLLLALVALADAGHLPRPVGAAHFHHGLRGADADADAAFSAALCARLGVPCVVGMGAVQPARGESQYMAARTARYAFLVEAARDLDADLIATAHTFDDQAETVLGRILRGTSVDGLAGIPASRDLSDGLTVVRPLLNVRRAEIEAYCAACGVEPRRDPSNEKPRYTRSRIRRSLPELAVEFNPRLTDALVRLSEQAARDSKLLTGLADALYREALAVPAGDADFSLDMETLRRAAPALRGRVLLRVLRETAPTTLVAERSATMENVARLEALIESDAERAAINLPGDLRAWRAGDELRIGRAADSRESASHKSDTFALTIPGETIISALGLRLGAREREVGDEPRRERRSLTVDIAYNLDAPAPLIARFSHTGERFAPLGMGGRTRPVRDLLTDARVPVARRTTIPVVARADTDEPLWLIGVCQAESTRVDESEVARENKNVLRLTAEFEQF